MHVISIIQVLKYVPTTVLSGDASIDARMTSHWPWYAVGTGSARLNSEGERVGGGGGTGDERTGKYALTRVHSKA